MVFHFQDVFWLSIARNIAYSGFFYQPLTEIKALKEGVQKHLVCCFYTYVKLGFVCTFAIDTLGAATDTWHMVDWIWICSCFWINLNFQITIGLLVGAQYICQLKICCTFAIDTTVAGTWHMVDRICSCFCINLNFQITIGWLVDAQYMLCIIQSKSGGSNATWQVKWKPLYCHRSTIVSFYQKKWIKLTL